MKKLRTMIITLLMLLLSTHIAFADIAGGPFGFGGFMIMMMCLGFGVIILAVVLLTKLINSSKKDSEDNEGEDK